MRITKLILIEISINFSRLRYHNMDILHQTNPGMYMHPHTCSAFLKNILLKIPTCKSLVTLGCMVYASRVYYCRHIHSTCSW